MNPKILKCCLKGGRGSHELQPTDFQFTGSVLLISGSNVVKSFLCVIFKLKLRYLKKKKKKCGFLAVI